MNFDWIVVGLGNPGPKYAFTRHNIGFIALDVWAQEKGVSFSASGLGKKIKAEYAEIRVKDKNVLLVKPQTFMNLSGESLSALIREVGLHVKDTPLICLHDEIDVAMGKVRLKKGGSDAGHNGLKSLREHLGHGEYFRVRMGVGRPAPESKMDVAAWVLQNFSKDEEALLVAEIEKTLTAVETLICEGLEKALVVASREK